MNKPRTQNSSIYVAGWTLMEVMVTLIIVAIVTALAMPVYNKTIDEMRKKEAKTILGTIRSAELIYKIDKNEYRAATFGSDTIGDTARSDLNVDVRNNDDWEYGVSGVSGTGVNARATATARRRRGKHSSEYINLTISNGTITEYSW